MCRKHRTHRINCKQREHRKNSQVGSVSRASSSKHGKYSQYGIVSTVSIVSIAQYGMAAPVVLLHPFIVVIRRISIQVRATTCLVAKQQSEQRGCYEHAGRRARQVAKFHTVYESKGLDASLHFLELAQHAAVEECRRALLGGLEWH